MLQKIFLIAFAGACGTVARFSVSSVVNRFFTSNIPMGTFAVNMLGCFLFAFISAVAAEKAVISENTELILLTGFMGAFTTFSTFISDSGKLYIKSGYIHAFMNISMHLIIGLVFFFLGTYLAKIVVNNL